jgi:hypothetical protein
VAWLWLIFNIADSSTIACANFPTAHRRAIGDLLAPKRQWEKSEIRISKSETNSERKKSQIGKIQNTESEGSLFGILPILVI